MEVTCPTCSSPLTKPNDSSPAICRKCAVNQLLLGPSVVEPTPVTSEDFELQEEIGRGGEGTVYLGYDKKFNRKVAVKIIKSLNDQDRASVLRFRAEAQAIAALDHPHIIPIYASGEMRGRPYFTMKYVSDGNLADNMELFDTPRKVVKLMHKIVGAIHHAHTRGILHRDIKPSNILLDANREPYVTDFGLAKSANDTNRDVTIVGMIVGTPAYMSPEQARGDTLEITTRSDIFSLGSIFYQLLTGNQAFKGTNSQSTISQVIEEEIRFPTDTPAKVDRDLRTICLKALEKDPDKRYYSALAMQEDLENWQKGLPVSARPISSTERLTRLVGNNPLPSIAIAIAVASLVLGSIVSTFLWLNAKTSSERSEIARLAAEENHYYSTLSSALGARERSDFGDSRRQLLSSEPDRRTFDWRLVNGLSKGDQVWSSNTGSEGNTTSLTTNPATGDLILVGPDKLLRRISPESGALSDYATLPLLEEQKVQSLSFSPDGRLYFYTDEKSLYVADTANHVLVAQQDLPLLASVVWLDNSRILYAHGPRSAATPAIPSESAAVYNVTTNSLQRLPSGGGWTGPCAVTPDGKTLSIVKGGHIAFYPTSTTDFSQDPTVEILGRPPFKNSAFSGNGRQLAIVSGEKRSAVRVYDVAAKSLIFSQNWPSQASVSFCPQTSHLILSGQESWLTRWDYFNPEDATHSFDDGYSDSAPHAQGGPFSPPLNLLTRSAGKGRCTFYFGHHSSVTNVIHLAEENTFISLSRDGTLKKWSNTLPSTFSLRRDNADTSIHLPRASQNGEHIAYLNSNGFTEVWHRSASLSSIFPAGHEHLAPLDDGRILTKKENTISCWESHLGYDPSMLWEAEQTDSTNFANSTIATAVNPDETVIAVLLEGEILVIDITSQEVRRILIPRGKPGISASHFISISNDGQIIALSGSQGYYTCMFQRSMPGDRFIFRMLKRANGKTSLDTTNVFSSDGKKLYVGHEDGWITVFDTTTLEELESERWQAHSFAITYLTCSQAGDIIASSGGQSTTLWSTDVPEGEVRRERLRLNTGTTSRNWLQFCGEDTWFLHSGLNRPIEVWPAPY